MEVDYSRMFPKDGFTGDESYTGLRLEVMGQYQAQSYVPGENEVCISISSQGHGVMNPVLHPGFVEVLRLNFDDVAVGDAGDPSAKTINRSQARQAVDFALKHKDRKKMVIHCFAGISRSRSTAAAIRGMLDLPYHFTVMNPSVFQALVQAYLEAME